MNKNEDDFSEEYKILYEAREALKEDPTPRRIGKCEGGCGTDVIQLENGLVDRKGRLMCISCLKKAFFNGEHLW